MKQIDCRNWQCPKPVIEVRKAMLADPLQTLEVLLADEAAYENVSRLAQKSGFNIEEKSGDGFTTLTLKPSQAPTAVIRDDGISKIRARNQVFEKTLLLFFHESKRVSICSAICGQIKLPRSGSCMYQKVVSCSRPFQSKKTC